MRGADREDETKRSGAWWKLRESIRATWESTIGRLDGHYERCLAKELSGCESVLDVGCGFNSPVRTLRRRPQNVVGVDAWRPAIEASRALGIHDEYHHLDILSLDSRFRPRTFDAVLASDVIEHLTKQDGFRLIAQMERVARHKVIVYTPNGFLPQGEEYGNPFQKHLSGWSVRQMRALGFRVRGIEGLKPLRGEVARIRWKPYRLWLSLSLMTQSLTERIPTLAFRLLCVKDTRPEEEC